MTVKKNTQHVVRNPDGGWSVKKSGADRASGTFTTQKDAITSGRRIAANQGTSLFIHGRDGRIKSSVSSTVPLPPKSKK